MEVVTFNGKASDSFDIPILIESPPTYVYPERDYEVQHVPGRNGDIYIDKNSYKNVQRSYALAAGDDYESYDKLANQIATWLHSATGYAKLYDTYEPEYYRMAMYVETGTLTPIVRNGIRITANFNCKPQRFLHSGDDVITVSSSNTNITNPTQYTSRPIVTVYGSGVGTVTINGIKVTLNDIDTYTVLNSEIDDAYKGTVNKNPYIVLDNGIFPELKAGDNTIIFTGGVTKVEVIPKWWTL